MTIRTHFDHLSGVLTVTGDRSDNSITIGRDEAGNLQLNGDNIQPHVTNAGTSLIRVFGNADADVITMDVGALPPAELHGGGGNDVITGGSAADQLFGDAGDDVLKGMAGNDTLHGGDGNDILIGGTGSDQVFGDAGNDRMIWNPGDGSDLFEGGAGFDVAQVNGPNASESFTIAANGARASFNAAGAATFSLDIGSTEQIVLDAGHGADTATVNDLTGTTVSQVTIDLAAVPATHTGDGAPDTVIVNGTNTADHVVISGGSSAVLVNGLAAQIAIDGAEAGTDTFVLHGLGGDDNIDASQLSTAVNLVLDGGDGNDVIHGADFASNLLGGAGNDTVIGGAGGDHISGNDGNDVLLGGNGDNVIDGGAGNDQIVTNDGRDFLQGGAGDDVINAGGGNDTLDGNTGSDTMFGGAGDDLFTWNPGDGSDLDDGGAGTDTLLFAGNGLAEQFEISANGTRASLTRDVGHVVMDLNSVEHLVVTAAGGADTVTVDDLTGTGVTDVDVDLGSGGVGTNGDGLNDTVVINGTEGADHITLSIVDGALVVDGLASRITVAHFDAGDTFVFNGLGGDDVIDASAIGTDGPKLVINGGDGADNLIGSAGNDEIHGGNGDDLLNGGPGQDVLDGGPGNNAVIQDIVAPVPDPHHFDLIG